MLSSLWPYLLEVSQPLSCALALRCRVELLPTSLSVQVDVHVSTKFLGWVVAAYSVGQLVASPLLGFWADHRPTREPLIISLIFNVVFSVLYCYAGAFTAQHQLSGWVVLVSRAFIGIGAGAAATPTLPSPRLYWLLCCRQCCCCAVLCL